MRLGQLARQLTIKTDAIVRFLASQQITVESGSNTRLEDAHVMLVLQRFAPANESLQNQISTEPDRPDLLVVTEGGEMSQEEPIDSMESEIPETIKAPKVELTGLKVIGKIDLPEKKKPEHLEKVEELLPQPLPPPRRPYRSAPQQKAWKNPLAIEREREEREKKNKLEDQREQEKKRRTDFYKKRLKPQAPTKQARLVEEEMIEMPPLGPEVPKTWWGRFMLWLNT